MGIFIPLFIRYDECPRGGSVTKKIKITPCPPCLSKVFKRGTFGYITIFMVWVRSESIQICFSRAILPILFQSFMHCGQEPDVPHWVAITSVFSS